jgi:NADH-quinone oxidoreductase subunit L
MYDFAINNTFLIPLLPLIGAAISGFLGARWLRGQSHWPIWLSVGASAVLSLSILVGMLQLSGAHAADQATPSSAHAADPGHSVGAAPSAHPLTVSRHWFTWIRAGDLRVSAGAWIDPLTAVMLCVVCGIGFLITVFAKGYMAGEEGYFRFFAYLGLFIFAMTCLVMGNNLVMLYLGWEGVGLCSYLLIGYYYERPAAREAAKKAFLVNRIGDFGFGLGIMLTFLIFGTVSYFGSVSNGFDGFLELAMPGPGGGLNAYLAALEPWKQQAVGWIPFLLMVGAFGKSAQFPLHVWLPDAMEGPTPVSALIHAATMVTAGVYMIARCSTLFVTSTAALWTIALVGAFTAIFAATIALRQFDLKKVFAYSTISQLGFMFVGVAVLAPVAGVFHLVTHAFFKALLFLSSGVVMHAMSGELDMRQMGGLKRVLPKTRWLMLAGCLALAGFPVVTSGYWSKDEIVVAAGEWHGLLGAVLLLTALLTAYYTFRLYFRVFAGPERIPAPKPDAHGHAHDQDHGHEQAHHNHEPAVMILPLVVLAIGAIAACLINLPFSVAGIPAHALGSFLGQSPSFSLGFHSATIVQGAERVSPLAFGQHTGEQTPVHYTAMVLGGLIALLGIGLAYYVHVQNRGLAERVASRHAGVARLLEAKYWVDEIYQAGIVEPLRRLGGAFYAFDRLIIDGILWAVSVILQLTALILKITVQRGYLQGYAAAMLLGVVIILLVVLL